MHLGIFEKKSSSGIVRQHIFFIKRIMKKDIHPEYREVLFHDTSVDEYFIIRSTLATDQTKEWEDGKTYPYCPLDVSSASHPFYTGQQKIIDTGGRVERFKKRFSKKTNKSVSKPIEEIEKIEVVEEKAAEVVEEKAAKKDSKKAKKVEEIEKTEVVEEKAAEVVEEKAAEVVEEKAAKKDSKKAKKKD